MRSLRPIWLATDDTDQIQTDLNDLAAQAPLLMGYVAAGLAYDSLAPVTPMPA